MTKRLIVIHTAECGETAKADVNVANYLRGRGLPVHRVIDADSSVEMIPLNAPSGAARGLPKADGVHYEHAGTAHQNAAQWADPYSEAMLVRSAMHAAADSLKLDIPVQRVTGAGVRSGSGFCGHIDITNAYGIRGGHWDPGPNFPWDEYLDMVRFFRASVEGAKAPAPAPAPAPAQGVDLVAIAAGIKAASSQTLRPGSKGDAVKWLQALLNNKLDGPDLVVDGHYGDATTWAVIRFQQNVKEFFGFSASKWSVDGIAGPATWYWLTA